MRYKFSYRRNFLWKTVEVVGHKYESSQDKMVIFLKDGGLREIKNWKNCECRLGSDWFIETKKEMEKSSGQTIQTDIDIKK